MRTTVDIDAERAYNLIKNKEDCCDDWKKNPSNFYEWYKKQFSEQEGRCKYCHLPGDTTETYGHYFRPLSPPNKGTRGRRLEVDRMCNKGPHSPENCVLACYPCNNAKSDVFSYEEFLRIGKAIEKVKKC